MYENISTGIPHINRKLVWLRRILCGKIMQDPKEVIYEAMNWICLGNDKIHS